MKAIISRNPSLNKDYMYRLIKKDLENNEKVYMLVPEQFTLGSEIEAYKSLKLESSINFKVKSFRTIVNEVIDNCGGRSKKSLSENAQALLLRLIVSEKKDQLKTYKKNVEDFAFIELILDLIAEMKDNQIDLDKLRLARDRYLDEGREYSSHQGLGEKLHDLVLIIESYEKELAKIGLDKADIFNYAIKNIHRLSHYRDIKFYFYRFHDMSLEEISMLRKIDKFSKQAYINLILDHRLIMGSSKEFDQVKDYELFEISKGFYENISDFTEVLALEKLEGENGPGGNLSFFLDGIFSYQLAKKLEKPVREIDIRSFSNTQEEVENLSISIAKDIRNKGYRYKDLAVITTNSQEYFPLIKRDFDLNKLPYFIDEKRNLLDNPMVKYLKSSLSLLSKNLIAENIIQFLKHSFFDTDEVSLLDFQRFVSSRKLRGNMFFNDKYFEPAKEKEDSKYYEEDLKSLTNTRKLREKFLSLIGGLKDDDGILGLARGKRTYREHGETFYKFISNPEILENYKKYELFLEKEARLDLIEENKLVWNKFIEVLDDLVKVGGDRLLEFRDFAEIVSKAIDGISIGIIPPSQDQVIIGDIARSRLFEIKKIYVLGMTNIYYPIKNDSVDLFLEDEKKLLYDVEIFFKNTVSNKDRNSLLSFYEQLSTAKSELYFSYSFVNRENQSMGPAFINTWIKSYWYPVWIENNIFSNNHKEAKLLLEDYKNYLQTKSLSEKNWKAIKDDIFFSLDRKIDGIYNMAEDRKASFKDKAFLEQVIAVRKSISKDFNRISNIIGQPNYEDYIYSKSKMAYYLPELYFESKKKSEDLFDKLNYFYNFYLASKSLEDYSGVWSPIDIRRREETGPKSVSLGRKISKKIYRLDRLSISQLEEYRRCPYKHFMTYGIKLRRPYEYLVNPLDFGNIAHKLTEDLISEDYVFDEMEYDKVFDQEYKNFMDLTRQEDARNQFFKNKLKDGLKTSFNNISKQLNYTRPDRIYKESRYGDGGDFPALEIELKGQYYKIEGKIDRIDEFIIGGNRFIRVVDYKTGNKEFNISKTYNGIDIQLVIYLYAALSGGENKKPIGCFYLKLNDNYKIGEDKPIDLELLQYYSFDGISTNDEKVIQETDDSFKNNNPPFSDVTKFSKVGNAKSFSKVTNVISDLAFEKLFDHIINNIKVNIGEIVEGNINIRPYSLNKNLVCNFCEYETICQKKYESIDYIDKYNWKYVKKDLGEIDD